MKIRHARFSDLFLRTLTGALLLAAWLSPAYAEYTSGDGSLTARGFVQAEAFTRKDVDLVCFVALGSGLTWGAALYRC